MIFSTNTFLHDVYEQFRSPDRLSMVSVKNLNQDDIDQRLECFTTWEWDQTTSEFWVVPFDQYDQFVKRYYSALKNAVARSGFDAYDRYNGQMYDDETFVVCQWHDPEKQWAVMGAFNCCGLAVEDSVGLNDNWYWYSSLCDHNYYQQIMDDLQYNVEKSNFPTSDIVGLWANMRLDRSVSKEHFLLSFLQPQEHWDPISLCARTAIEEHLYMLQSKTLQEAVEHSGSSSVRRKI